MVFAYRHFLTHAGVGIDARCFERVEATSL